MLLQRATCSLSALVLLAGLAACGSDDPTDPGDDDMVTVTLGDFFFNPANLTIDVGTTVRWVNNTSTEHTATPDGHSEWQEWSTDASGQSFEHTFNSAGTYAYFCTPHQGVGMEGVIEVE